MIGRIATYVFTAVLATAIMWAGVTLTVYGWGGHPGDARGPLVLFGIMIIIAGMALATLVLRAVFK